MSLTEDDKKWLMDLMETFGTKFGTKLAAKFATKEDLERVETSLLTEFHKWASPVNYASGATLPRCARLMRNSKP